MNDDGLVKLLNIKKMEHRDLDDAINALQERVDSDQMQVARFKRKKLLLKDEIARLEDQLIPDIIA
ncbi:DUF465 domain-containing protein [Sphingorhabdus lutea]|uniref:DUF465 domain-containing protein n=1 Tax=Sphingorhabdus lutea TaxID=1913578 RepID=A0A1L3JBA3_9SPHN|nr:DUF465 domain-containing protein [Sphingorhabdus lutea]APG62415.1 DUF465 domain-containing protein [Sphingorhabdus lutea]